ncbi:MAG: 4Fe-4S dicluster domain-containing protein [Rhodospirillaceae bacterium]|jgi:Fe-S-cluster-containing dehydrogenase component|nr:4Fe-4S dicluster domain-containing protein [Rhodospirillaceae bacterium]MBT5243521.1 4Fe-4S dicluster domain-containing protein [Rhodospirillaceae bacterium]MBT5562109.1 4Fe-4S dicluster domain-containing protein [Rhodospirillaceae bacterium]MBT6242282.1 4Fe-4S dicluster domain-containing protein [Rhodospirillaceae bacterium]MBT7136894.1 4Fe-4S dicluster domain-containing protein [Rhodospirillaceae bacterium]
MSLVRNFIEDWSRYRRSIDEGGFHEYEHMWGMVIDLDKCTGCNACSVACYAENNLAVVGEDKFENGQGMHWMRIERYWDEPNLGNERVRDTQEHGASFMPMMCQQCNSATCEPVCPVSAAYHTPDGLNAQIYNRCVGSRYCANNCPYRLRYFNFFSYYEDSWPSPLDMQLNPDISVRDKGVMEKCTFCVQRIRSTKNAAKMEDRDVIDGEVQTACQQTCPTTAIVFGDLLDHESDVHKLWHKHQTRLGTTKQNKDNPELRGYRLYEQLNTEPSVTYLERVRDV